MPNGKQSVPRLYQGIMVSSTFTDLEHHRAALINAIKGQALTDVAMENDSAKPDIDVIDSSLQMVRDASAYIGVISRKYGQIPPCPKRNPGKLSITELEFNEAQVLERPILLFIMGDKHPLCEADVETNSAKRKKLKAFRERAKQMKPASPVHRIYATFDSLEEFTSKAIQAVAGLRRYLDEKTTPSAPTPAVAMKKPGTPREDRVRRAEVALKDMESARRNIGQLTPTEKIITEKQIGRASFVVINDDICRAATDIIVSSDDNHFSATGGVSKAILEKLGPDVRWQLDYFKTKGFRQGQVVITTGGNWDRRAIIHAAVIDYEENRYPTAESIRLVTRRILDCAVALGARSVALPVLGGGFATKHLTSADSVNAIASEILVYLEAQQSRQDGLAHIAFYIYKRDDADGLPEELRKTDGAAN
jgi:O-acetyl-ADP-ribose deacetylase (regulator of RNase III)